MAKVSLRIYNREIEGLIEHGQRLDEAIVHCRHILKTFPKHLETYRLLGKAYLEAKRYDQAVDIFQRVLVVAPDDFVSHVGMSIIADDKGKLDDAIWHMERAFEVQPSNAAIQGELQRLFGRRDGVEPPKIRLTRGALAHMYVQGELYTQAISEIRAVLGNDPKRTDMQTLLAIAYFRNGQKPEATDICNDLLARFPYCLDANRLMVEILPGTQRADSIQEYRQRVIELDPYAAFAPESIFHSESAADSAVSLERLEYTGQSGEAGATTLGIGLESDSTAIGRSSEQPRWLRDASASEAPTTFEVGNVRTPASKSADEIPDFLQRSGWGESSGGAQETPSSFGQEAESSAAIEGDLPDWVKALAPADEEKPVSPSTWPAAEASQQSDETPDWLHNLGSETSPEGSRSTPETQGVLPDEGSRSISGRFPEEHPEDARGFIPTTPESSLPGSDTEETPDWLKNLGGRELDEPAAPSKASADADWLGELRAEQAPAPQSETPAAKSPDWLKDFNNDLETPIQKTEAAQPKQMMQPAADSLAEPASSLGSLGTTPQEQDDALAWLEGLAAKHGAKSEELVSDPNARTEVAPDWVDKAKEIGEEPSVPAGRPATSDDKTDIWLRNLKDESETLSPKHETPELFDLRSSLSDRGIFAGMNVESEKEETPIMDERDTPEWFSELGPKPAQNPAIEDAPDWLRGMSAEPSGAAADTPEASAPMSESGSDLAAEGSRSAAEQSQGQHSDAIGDLPAWLASLDNDGPNTTPHGLPTDRLRNKQTGALPAWLQADAEPEPQVTKQEAQELRADWRPVDESKQPLEEQPVAEAQAESVEAAPSEKPALTPVQKVAAPSPVAPRPRPAGIPSRPVAASLGGAQSELGRGNIAAALDLYGRLIRKGKSLEDIIRDLRDALYRYPVEVPIWQALGDAYMRANRLQEALDAYTKAEELLR